MTWPLFKRDLMLSFRSGGGFGLGLAFYLIFSTLVPLGIGTDRAQMAAVAPGLLWLGALLACLLSLERIFQIDWEDGSLDLLATAPVPLEGIALTKAAVHWVTTGLPLALFAPILGVMLQLPTAGLGWLIVAMLLGTPALSLIGTFAAALTVGVKRGGLLLSLLVLPFFVPTLILGAMTVTRGALESDVTVPLALLAAVSAGCLGALPFATAAALRINLR